LIEIGAGTGGTTSKILPGLKSWAGHIEEYCFTDISRAFLQRAEETFSEDYPYLRFRIWDIDQPSERAGTYDVVIAANVLHATANIRTAVRNARSALSEHGLLVLNEISEKSLFTHLTFGLLKGWWLYEDPELRLSGSPLIAPDTWQQVLVEEGLQSVRFPAREIHSLGQQIVLAENAGVIHSPVVRKIQPARIERTVRQPDANVAGSVVEALSASLKLTGGEIDPDVPFSDYGMDSLISVSFVKQVGEALGVSLNPAVIFDYPTVNRLSAFVQEQREETFEQVQPEPPVLVEPPPRIESGTLAIAVIGMSGQFPGAENVGAFWKNLVEETDGINELPAAYLDRESAYHPTRQPGKTTCKWGGVLEDRACFDPLFFNLSPREAESMSPHQRLILQEGWKGLEDAGYDPKALADRNVGLFVGAEPSGYIHKSFTGASEAIIASRLSYFLNLKGPSLVVNTACSSSAVAIHLACEHLRAGKTEMALAGGVAAFMSQEMLVALSQIDMLSPTGRCHTFDAAADGTVFSEGVGLVVLKRLEDAVGDGDSIYGVIEGSGMNQDGASNGITAPNGVAQEALMAETYQQYAINP
ncbi:MAG: beta-ketoacyl synthase N-terminal-like domain-containing protein, partial [Verrucomicrobiota bacterium]